VGQFYFGVSGPRWVKIQSALTSSQPTKGTAFSQTQPSAIKYECKPAAGRLTCTFTQLDVYIIRSPSVENRLKTQWAALDQKRCTEVEEELSTAIEQHSSTERQKNRKSAAERRIDALKATVEHCRTGDRESWREYLTEEHERRQKTCTVDAHTYTQTFRLDSTLKDGRTRWITEPAPYGECQLSREASFTSEGSAWSYEARYRVLNKSARQGSLRCEEIREQHAAYEPSPSEEAGWIECETIRFSGGCHSPDFPCLGGPPVISH
jgi:hypothetical protein